jgi:hypothetical protein
MAGRGARVVDGDLEGLTHQKILADFSGMKFEAIAAPY